MHKNRLLLLLTILFSIAVIVSFFIPRETYPSANTRIILEHNKKTYIAPLCFEQSDATNYIEDSTLETAKILNYKPHSSCTQNALKNEKDRLIISLLKDLGVLDKKWDKW